MSFPLNNSKVNWQYVVLIAIITFVGPAVTTFLDHYYEQRNLAERLEREEAHKNEKARLTTANTEKTKKLIYQEMNALRIATGADRIYIVKEHNHGGEMRPSSFQYMSILYEDSGTKRPVKDRWQQIVLPDGFSQHFTTSFDHGFRAIRDVPKDEFLNIGVIHTMFTQIRAKELYSVYLGVPKEGNAILFLGLIFEQGNPSQGNNVLGKALLSANYLRTEMELFQPQPTK